MKNNLVSIVVPIYNGEKFLDRCVSSLLSQTYENLQIILINDGGYHFDTIEDGKKYVDAFEIEEQKRIAEWRERNKK